MKFPTVSVKIELNKFLFMLLLNQTDSDLGEKVLQCISDLLCGRVDSELHSISTLFYKRAFLVQQNIQVDLGFIFGIIRFIKTFKK